MIQAELQRARVIQLPATGAPAQPSPADSGSPAHYRMSPRTPTNLLTAGLMFFTTLVGTSFTVWKRDPTSGVWAVLLIVTPPTLLTFTWYTVCDLNASDLYFQSDHQGTAGIFIEEIGFAPPG